LKQRGGGSDDLLDLGVINLQAPAKSSRLGASAVDRQWPAAGS
jgi:hypothetical protein